MFLLWVQLADFGLSRVLETHATHVSTKTYGTLAYMPGNLPCPATDACAVHQAGMGLRQAGRFS